MYACMYVCVLVGLKANDKCWLLIELHCIALTAGVQTMDPLHWVSPQRQQLHSGNLEPCNAGATVQPSNVVLIFTLYPPGGHFYLKKNKKKCSVMDSIYLHLKMSWCRFCETPCCCDLLSCLELILLLNHWGKCDSWNFIYSQCPFTWKTTLWNLAKRNNFTSDMWGVQFDRTSIWTRPLKKKNITAVQCVSIDILLINVLCPSVPVLWAILQDKERLSVSHNLTQHLKKKKKQDINFVAVFQSKDIIIKHPEKDCEPLKWQRNPHTNDVGPASFFQDALTWAEPEPSQTHLPLKSQFKC